MSYASEKITILSTRILRSLYRKISSTKKKIKQKKGRKLAMQAMKNHTPDYFIKLASYDRVDKQALWYACLILLSKRHPVISAVYERIFEVKDAEIKYLLELRKALTITRKLDEEEVDNYGNFYLFNSVGLANQGAYRSMLVSLLIKNFSIQQVENKLNSYGLESQLTAHDMLKLIKKSVSEKNIEKFIELTNREGFLYDDSASLKISYWKGVLEKNGSSKLVELEEKFISLDKIVSKEYKELLYLLYKKIPENKNYLDVSLNNAKLCELKEIISSAVKKRLPFSFVRFNDGEGYGFSDELPCGFDVQRQELHWWGEVLEEKQRKQIQNEFLASLNQHDFIGIPSVLRFIDELSISQDFSVEDNPLACRLFTLCHGFLSVYDRKAYITEGQINLHLFDQEYIEFLAGQADHVVFISGAKEDFLKPIFKMHNATYVELPTHQLLKTERFSCSEAPQPLPYVYKEYINLIGDLSGPGVLFFISAGFIGKIFAAEVAKSGGVALDVGQILMNIVANHVDT